VRRVPVSYLARVLAILLFAKLFRSTDNQLKTRMYIYIHTFIERNSCNHKVELHAHQTNGLDKWIKATIKLK
jgi:hypothetical protein